MKDFFISYAPADRAWAEWIAWMLEGAGFSTVLAAWDFRPGANLVLEMDRATRDTQRTLVVLSPDWQTCAHGMAQWAAVFEQDPAATKRQLLPVLVRQVEVTGLLSPLLPIDLVGMDEATATRRLLTGVAGERQRPAQAPVFPGTSPHPFPGRDDGLRLDGEEAGGRALPDVAPLPAPSRMPWPPNPLFEGRSEMLGALATMLGSSRDASSGARTVAITGPGGVGKTQLAVELVHRYGRRFDGGVFWLDFATASTVPREVAACGAQLVPWPDFTELPLAQQHRKVRELWHSGAPRLLVFDGCEDPALLTTWRPTTGGCRILLTSRRQNWDPTLGVETLPLPPLSPAASIVLLRRFRPDLASAHPQLKELANLLGGLPLALHLAGSYLHTYRHLEGALNRYMESLRTDPFSATAAADGDPNPPLPTGHEHDLLRTFAASHCQLQHGRPADDLARALLANASHLAVEAPIPRGLLWATVPSTEGGEKAAEDALHRLTDLGLLTDQGSGSALLIHPLIAAFVRRIEPSAATRAAAERVEMTLLSMARRINGEARPRQLLPWQPHLRAVADKARRQGRLVGRTADLCEALGHHLFQLRELAAARHYHEAALRRRDPHGRKADQETARSLNHLGAVLTHQGALDDAEPLLRRALGLRQELHGPRHPEPATTLSNLGFLCMRQQRFEAARQHYEQALEIREERLGAEHPETAASLSNLAAVLVRQLELETARRLLKRSLAIRRRAHGSCHGATAESLNNLGTLYDRLDRHAAARSCFEEALTILEQTLGRDHPETAICLHNLGCHLQAHGDEDERAQDCLQRALRTLETRLGRDHPQALQVRAILQPSGSMAAS